MKFKFAFLIFAALLLVGCEDTVPSTTVSAKDKDGKLPPPQKVEMMYLGPAHVEDSNDPMNGCRVYVYKIEGYIQTAILCNGKVLTSSAHHQKKKSDDDLSDTISSIGDAISDDE